MEYMLDGHIDKDVSLRNKPVAGDGPKDPI